MKRSLKLPITLAVIMIVLVILLIVGWVLVTVFAAMKYTDNTIFWVLLPVGSLILSLILAGVIVYLVLSIKMINLTHRQSNFVDSVTHELKSPIASIMLSLQTLTKYNVEPEKAQSFYTGMMEEAQRLDTLVNQVLRAGQLEAGLKIADSPEELYLHTILESAIHSASQRYRLPDDCVIMDCPANLRMFVSRVPLEMILRNLIDNAIKYGGDPLKVDVKVRRMNQQKIAIRVSDNGAGIPPHLRKKVFQRFVRLGSELERRRKGTGLGLYIVRMCLYQLHGDIRIRDNKRTQGTSFYVLLPITPENES